MSVSLRIVSVLFCWDYLVCSVALIIYTFCLLLFSGKAFNNSQMLHYAASNIISGIMFGKRFEYKDPAFQAMVDRDHESIHLTGSASILVLKSNIGLIHWDFTMLCTSPSWRNQICIFWIKLWTLFWLLKSLIYYEYVSCL